MERLQFAVPTLFGLEGLCADEMRRLALPDVRAENGRVLCAGTPGPEGKLTTPSTPMEELAHRFDYVLVEADGAAGRPLDGRPRHGL